MEKITIDSLQDNLGDVLIFAKRLAEKVGRGKGGREMSLCITNIEQAYMWLMASRRIQETGEDIQ